MATIESVTQAVEDLRSRNLPVGIRAVMRLVGGGQDTIKALLQQVPSVRLAIESAPEVPESVTKLWKSCIAEHIKGVLAECQQKLDAAAELIKTQEGRILDSEVREMELAELLAIISTERDRARAERDAECAAHAQTRLIDASHRERFEKAEAIEALTQHRLEDMVQSAQAAEVKVGELEQRLKDFQQQLSRANEDNAHLKGQIDGLLLRRESENLLATPLSSGAAQSSAYVRRVGSLLPPPLADQFDDDDVPL
ncbi:hypothetical protein [Hydrogenophaga sp.]|uniref:hypothetical protein n=1 Tax=Hydrogenophaga sp. TaxID=1904254 RepID=UPI0026209FF0|nr:hypothetical protein [Hydrogenophaga sp.]